MASSWVEVEPGKIELGIDAVFQYQSSLDVECIGKRAYNISAIIEPSGLGAGGAGKIKLRKCSLDEKKAVLGPRVVKPETDNVAAGIDVVRFTGSAVGYVKELEVESLRGEWKTREKQEGEKKLSKHSFVPFGRKAVRKQGTVCRSPCFRDRGPIINGRNSSYCAVT
jgi:hypothetical protein